MDENAKIKVTNMENGEIMVILQNNNFKRKFAKGATLPIPFGVLEEAAWDDGLRYMFEQGMLYIEDKKARIELGFETEEEQTIVALKEGRIIKMLKVDSVEEMRTLMEKLTQEQLHRVADVAIEKEILTTEKVRLIEEFCPDVNILKAIEFNKIKKEG